MFELLKKKFGEFVEKVSKKEQTAEQPAVEKPEFVEGNLGLKQDSGKIEAVSAKELKPKISIQTAVKHILSGEISLTEKDLKEMLEEFEFSLLEADVEFETAKKICSILNEKLVGKKFQKKELNEILKKEIIESLLEIMETPQINLIELSNEKKPLILLFLGPNGSGKTTTIAKIASFFQKNGKTVLLAAADTFRAASIEQLEVHAQKLGLKVIKQKYGSDPTAVAFDAVAAAKSKGIDIVLIDSAGRQETNKNLLAELEKLARVIKPDLKIYIGESYSGQALLQQSKEFNEKLELDCFILTKTDVDSKGGTILSLIYNLKKPVLFIGTGQEYNDLKEFDEKKFVKKIVE